MKLFASVVSRLVVITLGFVILLSDALVAQPASTPPVIDVGIDKGIRLHAPDSTLGMRIGFRLQSQFYSTVSLEDQSDRTEKTQARAMIRRARLMLMGYLLREEFTYFVNLQFDKGNADISDALVCWHPNKIHTVGVGQFRVFDDRQFRISSAYLQFVERSAVSNEFSQGYDIGAFWNGSWVPEDDVGLNLYLSATHGEWKNTPTADGGFLYTGRAELLPLGAFSAGGDYRGGGLDLQPDPKLSIGIAASHNSDARLAYGAGDQAGKTDITSLFADVLFKYRHFSVLGEMAWRELENEHWQQPSGERLLPEMYSGYGTFLQVGRLVTPAVELNARYEMLRPEVNSNIERQHNNREDRYSLGATYYIHNHTLKIQGMITLADEYNRWLDQHERYLESRLQLQVNF